MLRLGFGFRSKELRAEAAGLRTLTVSEEVAAQVSPGSVPDFKFEYNPGQTVWSPRAG